MANRISKAFGQLSAPIIGAIPERYRETAKVLSLGLLRIPVIFFVGPRVLEINDEKLVIEIPLNRRTRNHVRSMYFGVLATGADISCGLLALRHIEKVKKPRIELLFKDFQAEFLKRAEGNVHFTCTEGQKIAEVVEKARSTKERQNLSVEVIATVPAKSGEEPVARFHLTLSLKAR